MDSGNSESLQSSNEAEEECDSRFNHHLMFDQNQINDNNIINPFFFTPNTQQQNQLVNLDSVIWSKTLPSFSDHDHFPKTTITTEPIIPPPQPTRNPRKRSRASRRAPTTVLTTDTSNFRAMVQEFTGIPSPPFTSSSSNVLFPRLMTSFDRFGTPSTNNVSQLPSNYNFITPSPSSLLDSSTLLMNSSMQRLPTSSSINQSSLLFLNPKSIQNIGSSNGFGLMGQNQVHEQPMPTSSETRNDDQPIIEPWVCPQIK